MTEPDWRYLTFARVKAGKSAANALAVSPCVGGSKKYWEGREAHWVSLEEKLNARLGQGLYRDFQNISFDPPPIPTRDFDWRATHKDYDGEGDNRCLAAKTREALIEEIDRWYEEQG